MTSPALALTPRGTYNSAKNSVKPKPNTRPNNSNSAVSKTGRNSTRRVSSLNSNKDLVDVVVVVVAAKKRSSKETKILLTFSVERVLVLSSQAHMETLRFLRGLTRDLSFCGEYRTTVTSYEAHPNAFMLPNHWVADTLNIVLNGRASITLIRQQENHENKRETHNLKPGDIFRFYAGTTVHFVNTDKNQKFTMVELIIPVNTPGHFESFFPAASRDQESYFNALSDEVLQAAFNVDIKQLRKLFQGQKEGQFVRASAQPL